MIGRPALARLAQAAGVPERTQEKDYVLAWLIAAMAAGGGGGLAFKGGTALRRCYFRGYRYSEDLDFTAIAAGPDRPFLVLATEWCQWVGQEAGIHAVAGADLQAPERRAWIGYTGPLGGFRDREIKLDLAAEETILLKLQPRLLLSEYGDLQDESFTVPTYDRIEIWAEKVRSLMQRTEPRDVYDLHWLASDDPRIALRGLDPFRRKASAKGLRADDLGSKLEVREGTFRKMWDVRLADQVRSLPEFAEVWRTLMRCLRQAGYL